MLPYSWYLLKVIICSGILFGYYWLFLRNKIFHQYNRFYLLAAMSLSLLLPLLKINFWQQAAEQNQAIRVLQAVSAGDEYMDSMVITAQQSNWSWDQLYPFVYLPVSVFFLLVMIRTLYLIRTLLKKYPVQQIEAISFVNTDDKSTPFSFLQYIFWNSNIDMDTTTGRQIFKHEVAHIQEKHTYDKLFVNIILIFYWCNPFFWFYRKELNMIHEFIADKKAVENNDTAAFAAMILQAAYPKQRFELTNNFFYSPIKRRLLMLTKNNNPKVSYIARLMVLPLAVLVFAAFTFKAKTNSSLYHGKKITVVIDAGHGGKDLGATSTEGIYEKDLTLAISKKVKELNSNDAIEIILTRAEDVYMSPQQKAEFAKNNNADLVISFHIDNGPKESANTKTGMSVWVAKDEFANSDDSKILASAIINEFSNNYGLPVMPQLNQRQVGVWILQAATCPSVLVEAGFINNDKDIAYLQTGAAKETIAKNVLQAIEKYASMNRPTPVTATPVTVSQIVPKETLPQKTRDTVPENAPIDLEKALLIVNGKVTGKGKKTIEEFNQLSAKSVSVKWLKKAEAVAKYGDAGADGACEVNYDEGAFFTTTYVDTDEMSVFYIGINNPFTVTVQNVKPEDLVVVMSQGSKSGSNGNYIARVTAIGEVIITLSKRDGTKLPASFTVKVKRVPDPTDPDFPPQFRKNLKFDSSNILQLKQKIIEQQQAKTQQEYAAKQLQLKTGNLGERGLTEKKLLNKETQILSQKLLLEQQNIVKVNIRERQLQNKIRDTVPLKLKQEMTVKKIADLKRIEVKLKMDTVPLKLKQEMVVKKMTDLKRIDVKLKMDTVPLKLKQEMVVKKMADLRRIEVRLKMDTVPLQLKQHLKLNKDIKLKNQLQYKQQILMKDTLRLKMKQDLKLKMKQPITRSFQGLSQIAG